LKCLKVRAAKNVYRQQGCLNGTKGSKKDSESENAKIAGQKMLTVIFYVKDVIHYAFVSKKQTVNGKFYKEVIKRLITSSR
jgi:hypothetical protein